MEIYDLSHGLYDGLVTHPSHPRVIINNFVTHEFSAPRYSPPCRGFAAKQVMVSDHAGTHVDAPFHFLPEGPTIEQQPLHNYFGPAVLVDASDKDPRRPVDPEILKSALEKDGLEIRQGDIVLIRAWKGDWQDPDFHHAAGINLDAAKWLIVAGMKSVGIDLGNIEDNADMTRQVHLYLLEQGTAIYENLANLGNLPVKRFTFAGFPLPLQGCTGSPVRAVAMVD